MEAGIFRDRFHDVAAKDKSRQEHYAMEKEWAERNGDPVPPPPAPPDERDLLARAFNVDCAGPNSLAKLARYESGIERSIDRCLPQLKAYQAARNASTPRPDEPLNVNPETGPQAAAPPVEPAAAPSKSADYHSNPKNGGIAKFSVPSGFAALLLLMQMFLHAVPELIAALSGLVTGPRNGRNHPKTGVPSPQPLAPSPSPNRWPKAALGFVLS